METPLPELLLQHGQFVRTLAYQLVHDPHRAEDAAQEAWLKLVQRPPDARGSLRGWMRRVLFNQTVNARRAEQRREARERTTARAEALPSAAEEVERGELLQRVVAAVVALDEPYRSTLLERYFQGREAREIAEATGTPLATVRSREQRALAELRARLDRDFGSRAGWALGLARLAVAPAATAAAFGSAAFVLKLGAALFVAALGGIALWRLSDAGGEPVAGAPQEVVAASLAAPAPPPPDAQREPVAPDPRPAVAAQGAGGGRAGLNAAGTVELHGRLVLEDGAPAAGAALEVHGWGATHERELAHSVPEDWVDPVATAEADGSFSIAFAPPRAFQFRLDARAAVPGYAAASWRWSEIPPGAVLDLGLVELPRAGVIEGRIVDAQGEPLLEQPWVVHASSTGLAREPGRSETRVAAEVDRATGAFRLEGVWPGSTELGASSEMACRIDGPAVVVHSQETLAADLVYRGPDNARRIVLSTYCEPYDVMSGEPDPARIRLEGAGLVRTAQRVARSIQSYTFDDLPEGSYSLFIDDPRFLPWSRHGVVPGSSVDADVMGSAGVRLSVLAADETPVERYAVRVHFRNIRFTTREFEVHDGAAPLAGGLLTGLVPSDYSIEVRCADGRVGQVELDALAPGETRALTIRLGSTPSVTGRVVRPDGVAEGIEVLLLHPAAVEDSDASRILPAFGRHSDTSRSRTTVAVRTTDASGAYRFELPDAGPYLAAARTADGRTFFSAPFDAAVGETALADLIVPGDSFVRGRVQGPPGAALAGLRVRVLPDPLPSFYFMDLGGKHAGLATLDASGVFELGPVRPGPSRVILLLPPRMRVPQLMSDGLEIGRLDVPEAETAEVDLTVLEGFPGTLRLEALVNGEARGGLKVSLKASLAGPTGAWTEEFTTDAEGRCDALVYAGVYELTLHDSENGWHWTHSAPVTIQPGGGTDLSVSIAAPRGSIELVDAGTGQPLAGRAVRIVDESVSSDGPLLRRFLACGQRTTDEHGRLDLELVPGAYRVALAPDGLEGSDMKVVLSSLSAGVTPEGLEPRSAAFPWTADEGQTLRREL